MRSTRYRRTVRLASVAVTAASLASALAACSSSGSSGSTTAAPASSGSGSLASVCPSTIKIQTSWYPEAEKGAVYEIVGPNGTVNTNSGTYTGTVDGVTVSIVSGGPFLGNQAVTARMYQDSSILLGEVSTDDAIESSAKTPVIAVLADLQKSPKGVIYDPSIYHFKSISDVAKSGATVLKQGEDASTDLLVASGAVKSSQLDYSYDGSPGRFVTSGGKDVIIDYATEAPYNLEHLKQWGKPLDSILLADGGYTAYENSLSVTPQNEQKYSACLKKFIPIAQQAMVKYATNPGAMNSAILKASKELRSPTTVTPGLNSYTDKILKEKGILANGTNGVAGSFDTARVSKLITSMQAVSKTQHVTFRSGLTASELVTNRFLDDSIKIP